MSPDLTLVSADYTDADRARLDDVLARLVNANELLREQLAGLCGRQPADNAEYLRALRDLAESVDRAGCEARLRLDRVQGEARTRRRLANERVARLAGDRP